MAPDSISEGTFCWGGMPPDSPSLSMFCMLIVLCTISVMWIFYHLLQNCLPNLQLLSPPLLCQYRMPDVHNQPDMILCTNYGEWFHANSCVNRCTEMYFKTSNQMDLPNMQCMFCLTTIATYSLIFNIT